MAGPGGVEVGKVSVRVVPDTSNFKKDLERKLTLKDREEVAKNNPIAIKFDIDKEDLDRKLTALKAPTIFAPVDVKRSQIKQALDSAFETPVKHKAIPVNIRIDLPQARKAVNEAVANLELTANTVNLRVRVDVDRVRQQIEEAAAKAGDAEVDLVVNESRFRQAMSSVRRSVQRNVEEGAKAAKPDKVEVPVNVDRDSLGDKVSNAVSAALAKVKGSEATLLKLDADERLLLAKLDKARKALDDLRTGGTEIIIASNAAPVLREIEQVQDRLNRLKGQTATASVALKIAGDEKRLDELLAKLAAIEAADVEAQVTAATDQADAELRNIEATLARLEARRAQIHVTMDVDRSKLDAALDSVVPTANRQGTAAGHAFGSSFARSAGRFLQGSGRGLGGLFEGLPQALRSSLMGVGSAVGNLGDVIDALAGKSGTAGQAMAKALGAAAAAAISLGGFLIAAGGAAAALIVAGAAITAAWGAVSVAIANIPAAIGLLGVPIAAVALGMEGIKKAAQTLKPEFDSLRSSVAATFEKGLVPAFQTLRGIFPDLTTGFKDVADSLTGMAQNIAKFVMESAQLGLIRDLFKNVSTAIDQINPGIEKLVGAFLRLASNKAALDVLVTAVNGLGEAFDSIAKNPALEDALRGLRTIVEELTQGFADLVNNGIELIAAAAPGVTRFLDSLTEFFNKFDWGRLGAAVGGVFDGLAGALDRIPAGTIEAITRSFEGLATVFQDAAFQQGIADIASAIPGVIDLLGALAREFVSAAQFAVGFIEVMEGALLALSADPFSADLEAQLNEAADKAAAGWDKMVGAFTTGGDAVATAAAGVAPKVGTEIGKIVPAVEPEAAALQQKFRDMMTQAATGLDVPPGATTTLPGNWASLSQYVGTASLSPLLSAGPPVAAAAEGLAKATAPPPGTDMAAPWDQGSGAIPPIVQKNLEPIPGTAGEILAKLGPEVKTAFEGLSFYAGLGVEKIAGAITAGGTKIAAAVTAAFATSPAAVDTAMNTINTSIQTGASTWGTTLQSALAALPGIVTTELAKVKTSIDTAFADIGPSLTAAVEGWKTALVEGLGGLIAGATQKMTELNTAITTGFTTVNTSVGDAFIALATAVQTGFDGMTTNTTTGMAAVLTAVDTGITNITTAFTTFFVTTLPTLFTNSFNALGTSITEKMLAIQTAFTNGFTIIQDALIVAFDQMLLSVITGMDNIKLEVETKLTAIKDAFGVGWETVTATIKTFFDGLAQIATDGMNAMADAVRNGAQATIDILTAAYDTWVDIFTRASAMFLQAGRNMGLAIAAGLQSAEAQIRAVIQRIINMIMTVVRVMAMIRSPSKVFMHFGEMMGVGLAIGLENETPAIEKAATKMGEAAVSSAEDALGALDTTKFFTGKIGKGVSISGYRQGQIVAQSTGGDKPYGAAPSGPVIGTMVVQTPQGTSAGEMMDTALFKMRHVRRGVYSGY